MHAEVAAQAQDSVPELLDRHRRLGDAAAFERLVQHHLPLVERLARRFLSSGDSLDDLIQVGSIGLLKALRRFDPERGNPFVSYAVPMVLGELRHHVRDPHWPVHVPRRVRQLGFELERPAGELGRRLARTPTPAELAQETGVPERRIVRALAGREARDPVPLSETLSTEDGAPAAVEDRVLLDGALGVLPARERLIVRRSYFEDRNQSEIAAELGISQIHVSRLLRRALTRLRDELDDVERGGR